MIFFNNFFKLLHSIHQLIYYPLGISSFLIEKRLNKKRRTNGPPFFCMKSNYCTCVLRSLPGLNLTTFLALIVIGLPV